jgi:ABC-type transporter Mla MlaB component
VIEQKIQRTTAADGAGITIRLTGDWGIEDAPELHQLLADTLTDADRVVLNIQQMGSLDITTMQVICSACKTAAMRSKLLQVAGTLPECLNTLSTSVGAKRASMCNQNNNQACIWFSGEK